MRAKAANDPLRGGRNERFVTKFLALVDIGKMDFDHGQVAERQRIKQRHGCMRVSSGVEDNAVVLILRVLNQRDEISLAIGLLEIHGQPQACRALLADQADLRQRLSAVDIGFTLPQHIQIGAVEDQDAKGGAQLRVFP